MPTPLYGLPLYGDDDTAELDVLLNGQSTAVEAALSSQFVDRASVSVATASDLPSVGNWAGRSLLTRDTGAFYLWNGTWKKVIEDTGWVALTLLNGWVNYGGAYAPAQARRLNGTVFVTGLVKDGSVTPGAVIANLPVGMRTTAYQIKTIWTAGYGARSLEIAPNGDIVVGDTAVNTPRTALDCSFPAEQ